MSQYDYVRLAGDGMLFDDKSGSMLIAVTFTCVGRQGAACQQESPWLAAIDGFATTFEILQTYTPAVNEIGFRVPYMPEGFPAADYFDSYTGDLATVGDFTQAQPVQCGYPANSPSVGDYLTVAAPLANPAPGQGRYYLTAVTHQGQTRYGRKSMGGVLSGRDPASFPNCQ